MVEGWISFNLGVHLSDHGTLDVTAVTDTDSKLRIVILSQYRARFEWTSAASRKAFHEGVIASDLGGQREFSWGRALDWTALILAYASGPHVSLEDEPVLSELFAREADPLSSLADRLQTPEEFRTPISFGLSHEEIGAKRSKYAMRISTARL